MHPDRRCSARLPVPLEQFHLAVFSSDVEVISRAQPQVLDVPHWRSHIDALRGTVPPARSALSFTSKIFDQPRRVGSHEVSVLSCSLVIHEGPGRPAPFQCLDWKATHFPPLDINEMQSRGETKHRLVFAVGVHIHFFCATGQRLLHRFESPNHRAVCLLGHHAVLQLHHRHARLGPVISHGPQFAIACHHGIPTCNRRALRHLRSRFVALEHPHHRQRLGQAQARPTAFVVLRFVAILGGFPSPRFPSIHHHIVVHPKHRPPLH